MRNRNWKFYTTVFLIILAALITYNSINNVDLKLRKIDEFPIRLSEAVGQDTIDSFVRFDLFRQGEQYTIKNPKDVEIIRKAIGSIILSGRKSKSLEEYTYDGYYIDSYDSKSKILVIDILDFSINGIRFNVDSSTNLEYEIESVHMKKLP